MLPDNDQGLCVTTVTINPLMSGDLSINKSKRL